MRFTVFLLIAILFPNVLVFAQVGGSISAITGESISITLDPQYPNPGEQVTATIDDYALGGSGAAITWYFDGLSAPAVANNRAITFTAPAVETPLRIVARLRFTDGRTIEAVRSISPLYLDLIIEPQTYTPIFYQGRALPTKGSLVNINALLQNKKGPVDSTRYSYTWNLNNKSVYGGARLGGNWAQIEVPHGKSNIVTISIQNERGITVARKLVAIPTVNLETQFYQINTLSGLSQRAIVGDITITGNSTSIKAVPYYLDSRSINGDLFTQWSINNLPTLTNSPDPFEINLEAGVTGRAQIGFKIHNLSELLQSDEGSFQVKL